MKIKYNREVDILLIRISDAPVDHAEENGGVISHFASDGRPVLLEIQGGKQFLLNSLTSLVNDAEVSLP